jgi:FkbM family methyltransferase
MVVRERGLRGIARRRFQVVAVGVSRALLRVRLRGVARLLYLTAPLAFPPGIQLVDSAAGLKLTADPRDYFSCMMVYGRYAPELVALLAELVQPGDSVMDVGAQLGYISSILARLVGSNGRVHSFEPDPNALLHLRRTIEANGLTWVKIFTFAAADRAGELTFNLSPQLGWSTAVNHTHYDDLTPVQVRGVRIDDLDAAGEIRRPVTFVKLDVEGFESSVLDGLQAVLARDRPSIITEVNPVMLRPRGQTSADLLARIIPHGYSVYQIGPAHGILSHQQFTLAPVDEPARELPFCDVLCVPSDGPLPGRLARRLTHAP